MKLVKALVTLVGALALIIVLNSKLGDIPPLGKFLDPFHGFWKNAESIHSVNEREFQLDGLKGNV